MPDDEPYDPENLFKRASALSASFFFFNLLGPEYFQIDSLRFELCMTLSLYGAILRKRALEVLPTDLVQSAPLFPKKQLEFTHTWLMM